MHHTCTTHVPHNAALASKCFVQHAGLSVPVDVVEELELAVGAPLGGRNVDGVRHTRECEISGKESRFTTERTRVRNPIRIECWVWDPPTPSIE
jgi:hypothetical protein